MSFISNDDAVHNFSTIWEHVECGITIIDAATREILAVNPVAARMFGDDSSKIIGKRCHQFICPAEECSCPIMDKGQVVDRSERKFVKADGTTIPIIKSVAKIQYQGRLALLESFTDISNLKDAEAQLLRMQVTEEANRAKSDFLSRMSHEMRTPMNAIIGMTKIAGTTSDAEKLKYCLSTIGVSATHLLGLINDVLDMAKIEAGKLELDSAPFHLEDTLKKLCTLVIEQTEGKGITLHVAVDHAMPMRYTGDEMRLTQVLTNLLSNAVKFTPAGGVVTLTAGEASRDSSHSILRFSIADTGIGMTDEQASKLFNAFEQADTSISRRFGGTGLGLAISKSIVEKMDGSISVESTPGSGSVFTVNISLERCPEHAEPFALEAFSGKRILVADPDPVNREQFAFLTNHVDMAIDHASSTAAAYTAIMAAREAGEPYAAVFAAYNLPEDGAATLASRVLPGCEPIIAMASFLQWNKMDREAREKGITHFLSKPLFPSAIVAALRKTEGNNCPPEGIPVAMPEDVPDFSHVSILLAEDVAINREIFTALLGDTGIHIDTAEDGQTAVDLFRQNPGKYDCIIMDVQMPGMDGYEATRTIRALDIPRAAAIPIIAMTANVFVSDIEKCLACGMNDHLAKPIDEKIVKEKIQMYCPDRSCC